MVGIKTVSCAKISPQMVKPRDIAGDEEEEVARDINEKKAKRTEPATPSDDVDSDNATGLFAADAALSVFIVFRTLVIWATTGI